MYVRFNDIRPSPKYASEIDDAYSRVMRSGNYILGNEVEAFEHEFAEYIGVKHCIGVGNGFDALQIALSSVGIGSPAENVLVPANAPLPTWMAVTQARATAVGIEPDEDDMVIRRIPKNSSYERLRAVIPVHLYGIPVDVAELRGNLSYIYFIEDCAQAHGATVDGKKVGSLGNAGCWSFYPTKNLGCFGDGGAITTNEEAIALACKDIRQYGAGKLRGVNSRLDELQAAFLRVRLKYLDEENAYRQEVANWYFELLPDLYASGYITLPPTVGCVFHQFVIQAKDRDGLRKHLDKSNIETRIHYPTPPYMMEYYGYGYGRSYPVTDRLSKSVLSLPIDNVTLEQVEYVCQSIREFYNA